MGMLDEAGILAKTLFEQHALVSTVTLQAYSRSLSNFEGDETLNAGSTSRPTCYIVRKEKPWKFDKTGLIEGGDAEMLVKASTNVAKDYTVAWNGNTYRVQDVLNRDQAGVVVYRRCNLFLITSEEDEE